MWRANTRDIRFIAFSPWLDIISPNCYWHMPTHHFVEQSPDPWPTNRQKKEKKRIRNRIEILPPDVPAAYPQFPVSLLSERMKTGKSTLPPMGTAVKLQLPVFLPSERRKTGKGLYRRSCDCRFSSSLSGGTLENAVLPPMRAAVKLQLPLFLLSEWRRTGKFESTAHASSGKAARVSERCRKAFPFPIDIK